MSAPLPFLKNFKKTLADLENVSTDFRPPSHWYPSGNYAVNKILSGNYFKAIPQGRITIIAGPSDTGKSFLLSNFMCSAQKDGTFILAIDTENALDFDYLNKIGVNTSEENFLGVSVVTIQDAVSVVSGFIKQYQKEYGKYNDKAPKVLIALDSLDMLLTETENDNFDKGVSTGDQGQRAKQMKAFLRTVVSRIKALNISFVGTHQVYPGDPLKGEGLWAINNAIRYSASQIILVTKLKLKEDNEIIGIRMKVETFKSRFAKLGSNTTVMVPYSTGMNPYSGLLELLEKDGIVAQSGAWWKTVEEGDVKPISFQATKLTEELVQKLLSHPKVKQMETQFEDVLRTPDPEELEPEDDKVLA